MNSTDLCIAYNYKKLCLNSGFCVTINNIPKCVCPLVSNNIQYSGEYCEIPNIITTASTNIIVTTQIEVAAWSSTDILLVIILPILGTIIAISLILLSYYYCRKR
jgi:hypothetical protein